MSEVDGSFSRSHPASVSCEERIMPNQQKPAQQSPGKQQDQKQGQGQQKDQKSGQSQQKR